MGEMGWVLAFILFTGAEFLFPCLTSIWFSAGAFAAAWSAFLDISLEGQLLVFLLVSVLALVLIRPAVSVLSMFQKRKTDKKHSISNS